LPMWVVIRNLTKPWVLKGRGWCMPSLSFCHSPCFFQWFTGDCIY
jgi:hypothetical protein